jgi:hypothetical protein
VGSDKSVLNWTCLRLTFRNTLAYNDTELITALEIFVAQTPEGFTSEIAKILKVNSVFFRSSRTYFSEEISRNYNNFFQARLISLPDSLELKDNETHIKERE